MTHRCGVSGKDEVAINRAINTCTSASPYLNHWQTELLLLHGARENPAISRAPGAAQDGWIGDNCMGHGIALLQREHPYIGLVNPISSRFQARDAQLRAINAGDPFKDKTRLSCYPCT
ncbi:hypothetical protein GQ600_2801 [Phytophthora cactorum]|nr:hypothetical protein GQ600_2801 [Phytophthora cactorum]